MSNNYGLVEQNGQLLFTENGTALTGVEVMRRLEELDRLQSRTFEQALDDLLHTAAGGGLLVRRIDAEYVMRDDGAGMPVRITTESSRAIGGRRG